jgi:uncharacterized protein YukE
MTKVLSTDASVNAVQQMLNTRQALDDQITTYIGHGDTLNTGNFDGPHAASFYNEWDATRTALRNASEKLRELADNLRQVNQDIQAAGGNA